MNIGKYILRVSLGILVAASLPVTAQAAEVDAGFVASAVIPSNQMDEEAAYFDLLMEPGQIQELFIQVDNPNTYEITVSVEAMTASTNRNGILNYTVPGIYDETMPFSFSDLVQVEEAAIQIPPQSSTNARVVLTMPEEEYEGLLLGGIRIMKSPEEDEEDNTGIVNQYSYVIAVRLWEDPQPLEPEFALGDVGTELVNYKAAIVAGIRNTKPAIAKGVSANTRIYNNRGQLVIEKSQEDVAIAPNSVFPMTLMDREGYGFAAGEYHAVVTVGYRDNTSTYEQDFIITQEEAIQMNGQAVNQVQNQVDSDIPAAKSYIPYGAIVLLLIVLAAVIVYKKK